MPNRLIYLILCVKNVGNILLGLKKKCLKINVKFLFFAHKNAKNDTIKMKGLYVKSGIYECVNVMSGAKSAIQKLKKAGHDIYIVTDSAPSIFEEKANWIKYNFDIDTSHIISMKHKWLFKCDVMVDDNLDNLLGGYHYDRVLFDYPWNRDIHDEVYGIHRVQNWSNALDVINKLSKKME